jgi:FMN phosphatase YigB (HAD superfamily)
MSRPLLVTDCDEVLLHFIVPFAQWLEETHEVQFDIDNLFHGETGNYRNAMRKKADGEMIEAELIEPFLRTFFETEMHRQKPIPGAVAAMAELRDHADIVVLTNLTDDARPARAAQLHAIGIDVPVYTNQGGKGRQIASIIESYKPSVTVFVDDLPHQHQSVAKAGDEIRRLHFIGEPRVALQLGQASSAHARIDDWPSATRWILEHFVEGASA